MSRTTPESAQIVIYSMQLNSRSFSPQFDFDVSKFRDPMGNKTLVSKYHDGQAQAVKDWIKVDPRMNGILEGVHFLVCDRVNHGNRSFTSFAFRDYHARWISRAVAEVVADYLSALGYSVGVVHEQLK